MVTHEGTLHGWLRIGGSGGLLFVAYTLCRASGFDDDDDDDDDDNIIFLNYIIFKFKKKKKKKKGDCLIR